MERIMNCNSRVLARYNSHSPAYLPNQISESPSSNDVISFYSHLIYSSPNPSHLRHLHAHLFRNGLFSDPILTSKLLLSYSYTSTSTSTSNPPNFISLFLQTSTTTPSISPNSIISHLSRSGHPHTSLRLFLHIRSLGLPVDDFTLPPLLRASVDITSLTTGLQIHALALKTALIRNPFVASATVSLYSGLSNISYARKLFDETPTRDSVLWTSMLSGYAQSSHPELALGIFRQMVSCEGAESVDGVLVMSLLLACGRSGSLRLGRSIHGFSIRMFGFSLSLSLGNALLDMYVKCGSFLTAERVFHGMMNRDVISYSTLILGHGLNGRARAAVEMFDEMRRGGIEPNSVTFLGLLSAYAHSGDVDGALGLLRTMKSRKLVPELKHYACVVDAMGRAGLVAEAEKFVEEEIPVEPDEAVLGALLFGSRVHGNVEVGERVARRLMAMRPEKSGYYAILANLYSDAGRFHDADEVRGLMKRMNVRKVPGSSSYG